MSACKILRRTLLKFIALKQHKAQLLQTVNHMLHSADITSVRKSYPRTGRKPCDGILAGLGHLVAGDRSLSLLAGRHFACRGCNAKHRRSQTLM